MELIELLIIDDEPTTCSLSSLIFNSIDNKYTTFCARNFDEAKMILNDHQIHGALVDYYLGEKELGINSIKYISNYHPNIYCAGMSATDRNKNVIDAINSGAHNFYQKPLTEKDLTKFLLATKNNR